MNQAKFEFVNSGQWHFVGHVKNRNRQGNSITVNIPINSETNQIEKGVFELKEDTFNIVQPFKIIPGVARQSGSLIFGRVSDNSTDLLKGKEFIYFSEAHHVGYGARECIFVAVLRDSQKIIFQHRIWNKKSRKREDEFSIFSGNGFRSYSWAEYNALLEREKGLENLDSGEWKLL